MRVLPVRFAPLQPARETRPVWAAAGLLACALWLWLGASWRLVPYDEGLMLTGALRVMAGDRVHRDFYANYGPAEFHLLAAVFERFGSSVGLERIVDLLMRVAIVVSCYLLAAKRVPRRHAVTLAGVMTVWLAAWGAYSYPVWGCLLLLLGAVACMLQASRSKDGRGWMLAAGGVAGLVFPFRYDVFAFVVLAFALALALAAFDPVLRQRRTGEVLRLACWWGAGATLTVVPVIAWLTMQGAWPALWVQVVEFPRLHYVATRGLPFPPITQPQHWVAYLPLLVLVTAGLLRWAVRAAEARQRVPAWPALLLALLSGVLFLKGVVRVNGPHMGLAAVPALLFVVLTWDLLPRLRPGVAARTLKGGLAACTVLTALTAAVAFGQDAWQARRNLQAMARGFAAPPAARPGAPPSWVPVADVTGRPLDRFLLMSPHAAAAALLVKRLSAPGDRVFVGNGRHDKVFISDASFYFLVDRLPGTRWHHFDPGLQNHRPVQQALIAELQAHDVQWVVRATDWDGVEEPNDSALSSGVFDLDRYLQSHYRLLQSFGTYSVWVRNDVFDAQHRRLTAGAP